MIPMGLDSNTQKSLIRKLDEAQGLFDKGNTNGGCHKLGDSLDQVEAQRGKKLTDAQADKLRDWVCCISEVFWDCSICN